MQTGYGQSRWQVGIDAHLLLNKYTATDPTATLQNTIFVATGSGGVAVERALKSRGLFLVSGLGYRQIASVYGLRTFPGTSGSSGVGVWSAPIFFRQNVPFLLPRRQRAFQLSVIAGLFNEFVSAEGIGVGSFTETNNGVSLTGRADLIHHYSATGCFGAELRFPIVKRRLDGLLHQYYYVGFGELVRTSMTITRAGQSSQATVSSYGSGYAPLGVGLRYHPLWGNEK